MNPVGNLPGESARASLKPAPGCRSRPASLRYLPGESARASLKQDPPESGIIASVRSPGRIGPGLIEATATRCFARRRTASPGRIGPGLIEACYSTCELFHERRVSPGRIGPGLIEARHASQYPTEERWDLPGESARASLKPSRRPGRPTPRRVSPGRIGPGLSSDNQGENEGSRRYECEDDGGCGGAGQVGCREQIECPVFVAREMSAFPFRSPPRRAERAEGGCGTAHAAAPALSSSLPLAL